MISYEAFTEVDIRVGTIVSAEAFPEARRPAYKLKVDFGDEIGVKMSSAQITKLYSLDELEGKQVLAVLNFPKKQIGPFMSEVLVLGLSDASGEIVLVAPEKKVPNGQRLH